MPAAKDYSSQRFGRLLLVGKIKVGKKYMYECVCDCGSAHLASYYNMKSGSIQSCGCLQKEIAKRLFTTHGHTSDRKNKGRDRTYQTWSDMRKRCTNPNQKDYHMYGGRGISVCERWNDYQNFLDDMGERPLGLTIDRIDGNGNYEPSNCRWADKYQQALNRVNHPRWIKATVNGIEYPSMARAALAIGIPVHKLQKRLTS